MTDDERKQSERAYAHRWEVLQEVNSERVRQDTKWGEQNHPDIERGLVASSRGMPPVVAALAHEIPTAHRARRLCESAFKSNCGSWAYILIEEVAEAIEAAWELECGRVSVDALRNELVQVAAVCVAQIEAIDRRGRK